MDMTLETGEGLFNYRVCALFLHDDRLLVTQTAPGSHYFLPGGRVRYGERAEDAIVRELQEELGISCSIVRPLWLNQSFFTHDKTGKRFHELCLYFLMDCNGTGLPERGQAFLWQEGNQVHHFFWMPVQQLPDAYFYPLFLKQAIFSLPAHLTLHTEEE